MAVDIFKLKAGELGDGKNYSWNSWVHGLSVCLGLFTSWAPESLRISGIRAVKQTNFLGGGFKYVFIFTPIWGRFPF